MVNAHGADAWRGGGERGVNLAGIGLAARGVEVSVLRSGEACGMHVLCELRRRRLAGSAPAVAVVTGVSSALLDAHTQLFPGARLEVLRNPMAAYNDVAFPSPQRSPLRIGYLGSLAPE